MSDSTTGGLIGGILGAGVGFFLGNPAIGWSIGAALGSRVGAALAPPIQGPRLHDLAATSTDYGASIPRVVGSMRVGGSVIWAGPLNEHSNTSGGGKGGGGPKTTTYTYTRSFAVAFCEGEADVLRIWAAKKMIADATTTDPIVILSGGGTMRAANVTYYRGTETQTPDPTIQSYEGVSPPAYLGTCYVIIHELDVTEYGGRLPPIEAEVVAQPGGTTVSTTHVVGPYSVTLKIIPNSITTLPIPISVSLSQIIWGGAFDAGPSYARAAVNGTVYENYTYNISQISKISGLAWTHGVGGGRNFPYMLLQNGDGNLYYSPIAAASSAAKVNLAVAFNLGAAIYLFSGKNAAFAYNNGNITVFPIPPASASVSATLPKLYSQAVAGTLASGADCLLIQYTDGTIEILDSTLAVVGTITSLVLPTGVNWYDSYFDSGSLYVTDNFGYVRRYTWDGASSFALTWSSTVQAVSTAWVPQYNNYVVPIEDEHVFIIFNRSNFGQFLVYSEDGIGNRPALTLADVISELATEAPDITSSLIDVTSCTGIAIEGYARTGPMSPRDALAPALALYQVDCVDYGGLLKFVPRSQGVTITVDPNDLGAHDYGAQQLPTLTTTRKQPQDLPRQVNLHFLDPTRDYQAGVQTVRRLGATEGTVEDMQYPGALTPTEAAQRADTVLRVAWRRRSLRKLALPHTYMAAQPGDVLAFSGYQLQITQIDGAPPGPLTIQAEDFEPADFTNYRSGYTPAANGSVSVAGPVDLLVLDIPALRDTDADTPGVYQAACGLGSASWPGAAIERSADGGATWSQTGVIGNSATLGVTTTALADSGLTTVFDGSSTVTVRLFYGSAASITELQTLNGEGVWLIGDEVLSAQNATLNADGTYMLSKLLRGQQGTEEAMSTHVVGERAVFVSSPGTGWLRQTESVSLVGAILDYRATTFGNYTNTAQVVAITYSARSAKPWSPVHVRGTRTSSGKLTISWVRRTRYSTNWKSDYAPLGEASELYDVDILNGSTVVRTFSNLTTPTVDYSATQQTTDFGSVQSSVSGIVYQRSATVGRGTGRSFTV